MPNYDLKSLAKFLKDTVSSTLLPLYFFNYFVIGFIILVILNIGIPPIDIMSIVIYSLVVSTIVTLFLTIGYIEGLGRYLKHIQKGKEVAPLITEFLDLLFKERREAYLTWLPYSVSKIHFSFIIIMSFVYVAKIFNLLHLDLIYLQIFIFVFYILSFLIYKFFYPDRINW